MAVGARVLGDPGQQARVYAIHGRDPDPESRGNGRRVIGRSNKNTRDRVVVPCREVVSHIEARNMRMRVTEAAAVVEVDPRTEVDATRAAGLGHTLDPDILVRGTGTFIDRTLAARCRPEGGMLATGIIHVPRDVSEYLVYQSIQPTHKSTTSSPSTGQSNVSKSSSTLRYEQHRRIEWQSSKSYIHTLKIGWNSLKFQVQQYQVFIKFLL